MILNILNRAMSWRKYSYVSLQTKVTAAANERFQECAKRAGLKSGYELMQVIVSAFLRVADPEHEPVSEEIEEAEKDARWVQMFADLLDATRQLNSARPERKRGMKPDEAILLFKQPGTKRYDVRRVIMRDDEPLSIGRECDASINAVIKKLRPDIGQALLEIGRACGTSNLVEAVRALIDDTKIPRIKDEQSVASALTSEIYGGGFVRHNNKEQKE